MLGIKIVDTLPFESPRERRVFLIHAAALFLDFTPRFAALNNHYFTKSRSGYRKKRWRGRADKPKSWYADLRNESLWSAWTFA